LRGVIFPLPLGKDVSCVEPANSLTEQLWPWANCLSVVLLVSRSMNFLTIDLEVDRVSQSVERLGTKSVLISTGDRRVDVAQTFHVL